LKLQQKPLQLVQQIKICCKFAASLISLITLGPKSLPVNIIMSTATTETENLQKHDNIKNLSLLSYPTLKILLLFFINTNISVSIIIKTVLWVALLYASDVDPITMYTCFIFILITHYPFNCSVPKMSSVTNITSHFTH